MIAANNGWVVALDNLSYLATSLSDLLCRMSTGGSLALRTLYENDEETIFCSMRPVNLTGIEELASRSDLLDRCLILQLPRIPDQCRQTEVEFWNAFNSAKCRIFGSILDAVAMSIRRFATTKLEQLPRMADFAVRAVAAEPALGLRTGEFMSAYSENRHGANETALEASPVSRYIRELDDWEGTPGELLAELEERASETDKRLKAWPKSARALSGIIKRLAPNLLAVGVDVEHGHRGRGNAKRRIIAVRKLTKFSDPSDPSDPTGTFAEDNAADGAANYLNGVTNDADGADVGSQSANDRHPDAPTNGDGGADGDDQKRQFSSRTRVRL
jgi:hypothetical protein